MKEPDAFDEIVRWCQYNRPDLTAYLHDFKKSQIADAVMLLATTGFTAGRSYQAMHGDQEVVQISNPYSHEIPTGKFIPMGWINAIRGLLKYSWTDIGFRYEGLTSYEQKQITREQFDEIVAWLGVKVPK